MLNMFTDKLKIYFSNIWFLWSLCLIFNIITFLFIYFKINPGQQTLALRYNILVGVEWYGKGTNLYLIPGVGLIISGVNFILFKALKNNQDFYSALTVFVSLSVQLVLFIAAVFLAKVN